MNWELTRDVIVDLWPLCQSGEASPDTRRMVDAFLQEDRAFATRLKESDDVAAVVPRLRLSPDVERRLLDHARSRAQRKLLLAGGAIAVAAFFLIGVLLAVVFLVRLGHQG
jgi:hypothetical protein